MAIAQIMPEPRQAGVVRRAVRIFEIFEIGRMGAGGMIAVDAVFGEQFPVATDRIFLRSADDRHALGRLFRNKLEIITGASEIGRQFFAVGGKADEEKIAEAIATRCMGELLAWVVLIVRRIAGLNGEDHQPAGIGENQAVITTL